MRATFRRRQKTLRSAIDWSHDLLAADERKLFRRLAVFVGGCTLEAIESVCNAEDDLAVFETVESLVDKSLVNETETHGEPRFAMLETIREYAGERLVAAGEDERVRERHLAYFLALAEETEPKLAGAEQAMWLLCLDREHENLRAALAWSLAEGRSSGGLRLCGALQRFWWARGHYSEGREWCARILASAGTEEPTLERARALSAAGSLAYLQGDFPAARALGEESLAIGRELGNRGAVSSKAVCARALYNLGQVASDQGDYLAARAMFHESLAISREVGSRFYMAAAMNALGILAYQEGDYSAATAMYHESLAIKRELGDRTGIAHSLNNLGNLAAAERDVASAQALYGESLAIMRELGHRKGIANALTNLAELACEHGDHAGARPLIEECLAIRRELADRPGIALSLAKPGGSDRHSRRSRPRGPHLGRNGATARGDRPAAIAKRSTRLGPKRGEGPRDAGRLRRLRPRLAGRPRIDAGAGDRGRFGEDRRATVTNALALPVDSMRGDEWVIPSPLFQPARAARSRGCGE